MDTVQIVYFSSYADVDEQRIPGLETVSYSCGNSDHGCSLIEGVESGRIPRRQPTDAAGIRYHNPTCLRIQKRRRTKDSSGRSLSLVCDMLCGTRPSSYKTGSGLPPFLLPESLKLSAKTSHSTGWRPAHKCTQTTSEDSRYCTEDARRNTVVIVCLFDR